MIELTLREWEPTQVELPPGVVASLARDHSEHLELSPTGTNQWKLRAQHHVGVIRSNGITILVRPKVQLPNLLALMGVELPPEVWRSEQAALATEPNLFAAMAKLFCVACERTTRRGIRRGYITREERLLAPRGRIDIREVVRRPAVDIPAPCVYDDHTPDIRLNQLLKAALARALRVVELPPIWRRRIVAQLVEFDEVSNRSDPSWVEGWSPLPMERHYEAAVRLGALLLTGSTVSDQFGATSTSSFLLDMNLLFERFVTEELKKLPGVEVEAQASVSLGSDGSVPMRPDIVFTADSAVIAVADCKYKLLDETGARTPDYYQALAYATAYDLDDAWLLYAHRPGASAVPSVPVRASTKSLNAVGIDLDQPLAALRAEIASIGREILRASSLPLRSVG